MKGRHWRHFSIEWPHMVAGLVGPAAWTRGGASPGTAAGDQHAMPDSPSASQDAMGDGWGAGSSEEPVYLEGEPVILVHHPMYRSLFGNVFLEDAVLRLFCQTATLSGLLFRDKQARPEVASDGDMNAIVTVAEDLNKRIQVLFGPVATTKLHRLLHHLGKELRNKGNLWEGDTSENETRHSSIKHMFKRSNKNGDTLLLQMLNAEETQSEVLQEIDKADWRDARDASGGCLPPDDQRFNDEDAELVDRLRVSRRGVAVALASVAARPGMAALPAVLGFRVILRSSSPTPSSTWRLLSGEPAGQSSISEDQTASAAHRGTPTSATVERTMRHVGANSASLCARLQGLCARVWSSSAFGKLMRARGACCRSLAVSACVGT